MATVTETAEDTITWTRLEFTSDKYGGLAFTVWKAERGGVIACGASPEQARARLAAAEDEATRRALAE